MVPGTLASNFDQCVGFGALDADTRSGSLVEAPAVPTMPTMPAVILAVDVSRSHGVGFQPPAAPAAPDTADQLRRPPAVQGDRRGSSSQVEGHLAFTLENCQGIAAAKIHIRPLRARVVDQRGTCQRVEQ